MTIRKLLVLVGSRRTNDSALDLAFLTAKRFQAHVEGLYVAPEAAMMFRHITEGLSPGSIERAFEEAREHWKEIGRLAADSFDQARQRHGFAASRNPAAGASASWTELSGSERELVGYRGRICDLTVLNPADDTWQDKSRATSESALFETGRPVLLAPQETPASIGDRVVLAWNRSATSARAVNAGMPFLATATKVTVVYVDTGAKTGPSAEELIDYLTWHGIAAEVRRLVPDRQSVGERLLDEAALLQADLLVMGAYSQSRLREMVLGGVTRHVLTHAALPVLMVH